jgi:uncharacterized membrane protein YGL010W
MKSLRSWLEEYGESHRNPVNEAIHRLCVPLITFGVLGMLWAVSPWLAAALVVLAGAFYLRLSLPLALGMLVLSALMLGIVTLLPRPFGTGLAFFVVGWIGQFYGHHVEGKRPSFFKDVQFLLVGPLWVLDAVYRRLGIRA